MAISVRYRKNRKKYQVKLRGIDGFWISKTFDTKADAVAYEAELKLQKSTGNFINAVTQKLTLSEYFEKWDSETKHNGVSEGWRSSQRQMFSDYVKPVIGHIKLKAVTTAMISRVIKSVSDKGRAEQTQRHAYNLLHKLFVDAIEIFQILSVNPVIKRLKPKLPEKEGQYLELDDVIKLLLHVKGKSFELAVWLGVYLGLRVGEIQALKWENVDLDRRLLHIRSNYARKEKVFREYPKGKKWHSVRIPQELLAKLIEAKQMATNEFVVVSPRGEWMTYNGYYHALKRYCAEIGINESTATHTLRHSTYQLYLDNGGTIDDLRTLFAHSSNQVTDRYIHNKETRLDRVANVIRLFPEKDESEYECSPNVPQSQLSQG